MKRFLPAFVAGLASACMAMAQTTAPATPTGNAPIASNFDPVLGMQSAPIPVGNGIDPVGAFRFICGSGGVNYDDPIVFPGKPGRSHLHQYYGVTANAYTTYQSLRTAPDGTLPSTCSGDPKVGGSHVLNRSAYWMPAILVGNRWVLQPNAVSIYYKRLPLSNRGCQPLSVAGGKGRCVPIPNGLKMIAGYDMVTNTLPTGSSYIGCITPAGHGVGIAGHNFVAVATCPVGDDIDVRLSMPDCWNGQLDSPNHRSHVAYMTADRYTAFAHCPLDHPYQMPTFTIAVIYSVTPQVHAALAELANEAKAGTPWDYTKVLHFSSDEMRPKLIPGGTEHADFLEAHDPVEKRMWDEDPNGCINGHLNCSGGDMGDGFRIKGASVPYYNGVPSWTNPVPLIPIPPKPGIAM